MTDPNPKKNRWFSIRSTPEMIELLNLFKPAFSLPGRPATRTYVVECLLLEATRARLKNKTGGAAEGAHEAERERNLSRISSVIDAYENIRDQIPDVPEDEDEEDVSPRASSPRTKDTADEEED